MEYRQVQCKRRAGPEEVSACTFGPVPVCNSTLASQVAPMRSESVAKCTNLGHLLLEPQERSQKYQYFLPILKN